MTTTTTNNALFRVSYETAKLAKQVGFNELCDHAFKQLSDGTYTLYQHTTKQYNSSFNRVKVATTKRNSEMLNAKQFRCSAPTILDMHAWLMRKFNIRVFPEQKISGDFGFAIYVSNETSLIASKPFVRLQSYFTKHYSTFEEALDAGIQEALELIYEKKK
jgi:hypothetical protein